MKSIKKSEYHILTINPGSTSTKVGVFKNEEALFEITVRHSTKKMEEFKQIWDQYDFRREEIVRALEEKGIHLSLFDAVVGRGGLLKPIPSGTYLVDESMIDDARKGVSGQHASNLGCIIAYSIGWEYDIPSFIVDPPAVDEMEDVARISGLKGIDRNSLFHALNIFATARHFAKEQNKTLNELNLIVAQLGGGSTVAALRKGRAINVNNGLDEGPFTPERSGELPLLAFMKLCLSGEYAEDQLKNLVAGKGGLTSYFNTNKASDVENMVKAGSEKYRLVYEAMAYQVAEEIGRRATNLKGQVDAIILTGGVAHSEMLCQWIEERVQFIAPVHRYPGELELYALAMGGLRVLRGEENPKHYTIRHKKVGVFYWDSLEIYVKAIHILEDLYRLQGYRFRTTDSNMEIIYHNCQSNEDLAHQAIEHFIAEKVDAILAIGSPATVRAAQYLKSQNIPVICVGIYSPNVIHGMDWEQHSNYYASFYSVPIADQIEQTILKIHPNLKRLGTLHKIGEHQSDIQHDEIERYCIQKGIELVSVDTQSQESFRNAYEIFLEKQVEWIILGADTNIALATNKLLEPFTTSLPTICILENTITHGGLIGYLSSWEDVCHDAVQISIDILNEESISNRMISPIKKQLKANWETAKKLHLEKKIDSMPDIKWINKS